MGNSNTGKAVFEEYAELVRRVRGGDDSAFTEIYEKSKRLVYTTCYGILNNEQDAEDAMQEAYFTAYNRLNVLNDENVFLQWLKTIAANKARDKYKARKGDVSYDDAIAADDISEGDDDLESLPDAYIMEKAKRDALYRIMRESLSDVQYQTILLFYYDELPLANIAQIMDCPVDTVKSRLKSSRKLIKAGVTEYEHKNNDKLMGAAAGTPFLTRFFFEHAKELPIPSIRPIPAKSVVGPKDSAYKAEPYTFNGAKDSAYVARNAVGTTAKEGVKTTIFASTAAKIAITAVAIAAVTVSTVLIVNKVKDNHKDRTVEDTPLNYNGLYCNLNEDADLNHCLRFYPDGEFILTSCDVSDDGLYPDTDWFDIGTDSSSITIGEYRIEDDDLILTFDEDDNSEEMVCRIANDNIIIGTEPDTVVYEFIPFDEIEDYEPAEIEPVGTEAFVTETVGTEAFETEASGTTNAPLEEEINYAPDGRMVIPSNEVPEYEQLKSFIAHYSDSFDDPFYFYCDPCVDLSIYYEGDTSPFVRGDIDPAGQFPSQWCYKIDIDHLRWVLTNIIGLPTDRIESLIDYAATGNEHSVHMCDDGYIYAQNYGATDLYPHYIDYVTSDGEYYYVYATVIDYESWDEDEWLYCYTMQLEEIDGTLYWTPVSVDLACFEPINTLTPTPTPDPDKSYQEAYYEFLTEVYDPMFEFGHEDGTLGHADTEVCGLAYINDDDIPELICSITEEDVLGRDGTPLLSTNIYTYVNGEVKRLEYCIPYTISYYPHENLIIPESDVYYYSIERSTMCMNEEGDSIIVNRYSQSCYDRVENSFPPQDELPGDYSDFTFYYSVTLDPLTYTPISQAEYYDAFEAEGDPVSLIGTMSRSELIDLLE